MKDDTNDQIKKKKEAKNGIQRVTYLRNQGMLKIPFFSQIKKQNNLWFLQFNPLGLEK